MANSWTLSGVAMAPIDAGFSVLGKPGVGINQAKSSGSDGVSAKKTKSGLVWGAGAQYDINARFGVRVEYEDFGKFGEALQPTDRQPNRPRHA